MKNARIRLIGERRGHDALAGMRVLTEPCIDFKLPGCGEVVAVRQIPADFSCPDSR